MALVLLQAVHTARHSPDRSTLYSAPFALLARRRQLDLVELFSPSPESSQLPFCRAHFLMDRIQYLEIG
jgi:hypothetical protein